MERVPPALLVFFLAPALLASDLNLNVRSGGQNTIKVSPGAQLSYEVVGELSDNQNDGLALFSFDLSFTGGSLQPANAPSTQPMLNFSPPLGLSNPAGFGGTPSGGKLLQVGGGQNTIQNIFAPLPIGSVVTGIAQNGQPEVLATGTLTAPYPVGSYVLSAEGLFANAIRLGETGVPFWKVDPVGAGAIANLTIVVEAFSSPTSVVSVSAGESQLLFLDAGPANAGRAYQIFGSMTGTSPGITLPNGVNIPLNPDAYFRYTRKYPNNPSFVNFVGVLDSQGMAMAEFRPTQKFKGLNLHHAFLLYGPANYASNPVPVQVTN